MTTFNTIPTLVNPPYDIQLDGKKSTDSYTSALIREQINFAGAELLLYKLKGLKERLLTPYDKGFGFCSKEVPNFEPNNAFTADGKVFHSYETGSDILKTCFLGYDFGPILSASGRNKYANNQPVLLEVTAIDIIQPEANRRVLKARVESSLDGINWKGISIVSMQDAADLQTIFIRESSPARMWRLKPLAFTGSVNDYWCVSKLHFRYQMPTNVTNYNIDYGIPENRSRSYDTNPIPFKALYTPTETTTEFNGFGLYAANKLELQVHFDTIVELINRPFVIGDIIEMPNEAQYDTSLNAIRKFVEVTDVMWSSEGYSLDYTPLVQKIVIEPLIASEENKDVTKQLKDHIGTQLFDASKKSLMAAQNQTDVTDSIIAQSKTLVPQNGLNNSEQLESVTAPLSLYEEDALPPEGKEYSEGPTLPDIKDSKDGDYFRVVYGDLDIPARLYKFSCAKKRWIFMEEDLRGYYDERKRVTQKFDKDGVWVDKI